MHTTFDLAAPPSGHRTGPIHGGIPVRQVFSAIADIEPACSSVPGLVLAAMLWAASTQGSVVHAESVGGTLEVGLSYSTVWYLGEETGDVAGHVFPTQSAVGRLVLQSCLPGMYCVVDGAELDGLDFAQLQHLPVDSDGASAMFEIRAASLAYMEGVLAFEESHLNTRFGELVVDDAQRLWFNGQPVMAPAWYIDDHDVVERVSANEQNAWPTWRRFLSGIRKNILVALGKPISEAAPHAATAAARATPSTEWEPVQGDVTLRMVDGYEGASTDAVVLMSTGGTACPALFRVVTLSQSGAMATPEFGACSEVVRIFPREGTEPTLEIRMTEHRGPFNDPQERLQAAMRLQRYVFEDGQVRKVGPDAP